MLIEISDIPIVPHVQLPVVDLLALPILWQVEAMRALSPPVAIVADPLALSLVFKDGVDAFCRGFDLFLRRP